MTLNTSQAPKLIAQAERAAREIILAMTAIARYGVSRS